MSNDDTDETRVRKQAPPPSPKLGMPPLPQQDGHAHAPPNYEKIWQVDGQKSAMKRGTSSASGWAPGTDSGRSNRIAIAASTMLNIWESNADAAKSYLTTYVKAKGPSPAEGLVKAILTIGIDVTGARLFGTILSGLGGDKASQTVKAVLRTAEATYKVGLTSLTATLGTKEGLRIDPAEFAMLWKIDQGKAINQARADLVDTLLIDEMTEERREEAVRKIKASAPTPEAMTQILLQQYTGALYYKAGDTDLTADGLLDIQINVGGEGNRSELDVTGRPTTATATISGLDATALSRMTAVYPDGVDPLALRMPFRISLWEMTAESTDREGQPVFKRTANEIYVGSSGRITKSDPRAMKIVERWGRRCPVVSGFGVRQAVSGFSKKAMG